MFLDRGAERIAVHRRNSGRNQYATHPAHMPDRLKAVRAIRKPDYGDILLSQARRIGRNALAWAERCYCYPASTYNRFRRQRSSIVP